LSEERYQFSFKIEGYEFSFRQHKTSVGFRVKTKAWDVTDDDKKWVEEYLNDMGKWENAVRAVADFLDDISITGIQAKIVSQQKFGSWRYDIEVQKPHDVIDMLEGGISLSREEALKRLVETPQGQQSKLLVDEIEPQAKNVQKWRNLKRSLSHL